MPSISIELCDDVKNGKIYPPKATIENAISLTKKLMKKYCIPKSRAIRHFDVTGKQCPEYWCGSTSRNKKWKTEFWNKLESKSNEKPASKNTEKKSNMQIAKEVLDGKWGNGDSRKKRLKSAGYDPKEIQRLVNKMS